MDAWGLQNSFDKMAGHTDVLADFEVMTGFGHATLNAA